MSSGLPAQSPLTVYFCGREDCQPGHSYGPAVRPHYLLHVILDGRGIYQYQGNTFELQAGDAFLIPPMETTYYQADTLEPWTYSWAGFDGLSVKSFLSGTVFADSFIFRCPDTKTAGETARAMQNLYDSFTRDPGNSIAHAGNLLLLFSCMRKTPAEQTSSHTALYFQKAREYIENNYPYPIKISDIARYTGIDRTYLYRIFMEQENLSPKQYLLQHRLRMAAEMLCDTAYSVTEISLSCGFGDTSSFCNYFRKCVGKTPGSFRADLAEERRMAR